MNSTSLVQLEDRSSPTRTLAHLHRLVPVDDDDDVDAAVAADAPAESRDSERTLRCWFDVRWVAATAITSEVREGSPQSLASVSSVRW